MAQLTFTEVEPAMEMVQLAEDMLKNYYWMPQEIERQEAELANAGEGVVGSYGDPNAGIRAAYKNSDKTGGEVIRRDRKWRRLQEMKRKVTLFERAVETITDYQESLVLEKLMNRWSMVDIAKLMGVSRNYAYKVRDKMVRKLAWAMFDHDGKAA